MAYASFIFNRSLLVEKKKKKKRQEEKHERNVVAPIQLYISTSTFYYNKMKYINRRRTDCRSPYDLCANVRKKLTRKNRIKSNPTNPVKEYKSNGK